MPRWNTAGRGASDMIVLSSSRTVAIRFGPPVRLTVYGPTVRLARGVSVRADALRNRESVLAAAGRLFDAAADPDQVSMDDIAAAAGVGKGTLFRRFGDRIGLVRALYERTGTAVAGRARGVSPPGRRRSRPPNCCGPCCASSSTTGCSRWRWRAPGAAVRTAMRRTTTGTPCWPASSRRPAARRAADYLAHALLAAVRSDLVEHLRDWPEARWHEGLNALVDSVLGQRRHIRPPRRTTRAD